VLTALCSLQLMNFCLPFAAGQWNAYEEVMLLLFSHLIFFILSYTISTRQSNYKEKKSTTNAAEKESKG
jgi:hypothetical protein